MTPANVFRVLRRIILYPLDTLFYCGVILTHSLSLFFLHAYFGLCVGKGDEFAELDRLANERMTHFEEDYDTALDAVLKARPDLLKLKPAALWNRFRTCRKRGLP